MQVGLTFSLGSSLPARASKSVDFPDAGGPNNNVILTWGQKEQCQKIHSLHNRSNMFTCRVIMCTLQGKNCQHIGIQLCKDTYFFYVSWCWCALHFILEFRYTMWPPSIENYAVRRVAPHLPGLTMPLTSSRIVSLCLLGRRSRQAIRILCL